MRRLALPALFLLLLPLVARADGEPAGRFDYYVLALSWSPGWCAAEGDADGAAECRRGAGLGFVLHGLWPQYERGSPAYCRTPERDATRAETAAMVPVMASAGLAWYQWKKHGRCSGLTPSAYFDTARKAFAAIRRPDIFARLKDPVRIAPKVVEDAFREANPGLSARAVTVTCSDGQMREVRICLTRELAPRDCAPDVARDCPLSGIEMAPPR